jgi:aspartate-semialdehyde dehydrogenase
MKLRNLGLVGWRGMVGSVLLQRMEQEQDFTLVNPVLFSTSQPNTQGPKIKGSKQILKDAFNLVELAEQDIIISCQGGEYTESILPKLRNHGWQGYWIDAASTLRMNEDSCIILDPVNAEIIEAGIAKGIRNFIGGNCTVSLLLMAIGKLFQEGLVEWVSTMTYQAASGAGAKQVRELLEQAKFCCQSLPFDHPDSNPLLLESMARTELLAPNFPTTALGYPLAMNVLPYIDKEWQSGQSREEWKGAVEANKILGNTSANFVPIDGICVRVPVLRSHSQAFTLKLTTEISVNDIERILQTANDWIQVIPNNKEESLRFLTPSAVSGTLKIAVGRLRLMNIGKQYLTGFTVGDQLLWGAAEPLRRMLRILL